MDLYLTVKRITQHKKRHMSHIKHMKMTRNWSCEIVSHQLRSSQSVESVSNSSNSQTIKLRTKSSEESVIEAPVGVSMELHLHQQS